jgi:hypothetical protein
MADFIHAAWPVGAAFAVAFLLWAFWRVMLNRSCWRCRTPLLTRKRKRTFLTFFFLTQCDRCGAWRGSLLK